MPFLIQLKCHCCSVALVADLVNDQEEVDLAGLAARALRKEWARSYVVDGVTIYSCHRSRCKKHCRNITPRVDAKIIPIRIG